MSPSLNGKQLADALTAEGRTISKAGVSDAVKARRLSRNNDGKFDLDKARAELTANTNPAQVRHRGVNGKNGDEDYRGALLRKEIALANLRELEEAEKRGRLIEATEVRAAETERATAEREALLNWPARIAPDLAAKFGVTERDMFMALDTAVREYLMERSQQPLAA